MGESPSYTTTVRSPSPYRTGSGSNRYRTGGFDLTGWIRSYAEVRSTPVAREIEPPALVTPEAYTRWGQPSDFGIGDLVRQRYRFPGYDPDDDDPKKRVRYTWNEEGRSWTDIRVENPDDPDNYAILRVATSVALALPDGSQVIFKMGIGASQPPAEQEGNGQTPPAPPELNEIGELKNDDPFKPFDPFE